jgi:hypothetical protein
MMLILGEFVVKLGFCGGEKPDCTSRCALSVPIQKLQVGRGLLLIDRSGDG